MIGLKNATPEEFEELYVKYGIGGSMDLSIPTFYFSLVMEENIIGYVKLIFRDEDYYLEEIKYDEGMERFNRFFIKCIAYKVYTKKKKSRGKTLGNGDVGQIESREAAQIRIAVVGHVDGNAVHVDRHMLQVETAYIDHFFVAGTHMGNGHARQQIHGPVHGVGVESAHGFFSHALDRNIGRAVGLLHYLDLAEPEGSFPRFFGGKSRTSEQDRQQYTCAAQPEAPHFPLLCLCPNGVV